MTYHGQPADYAMRIALAWIGPLRIELIEAVEGDSVYADFVKEHGYGVHHFGVLVDDMDAALAQRPPQGCSMTMDGAGFGRDGDGHYAYLDTEQDLGHDTGTHRAPQGPRTAGTHLPAAPSAGGITLNPLITIDRDAPARLIAYSVQRGLTTFTLLADRNTYAALGARVEAALRGAGVSVHTIVLTGDEIVADEANLVRVLMAAPAGETCYLAAGSGTLTDIARFASHRTRNRFISLPTAPSMDGYATSNNTLTIGGLKLSIMAHAPEAIFCDLDTLAAAPRPMIAAGFGDTLAKFTSVNDLRLGHLLWNERWDEAIGQRMEGLAQAALARAGEIMRADADAIAFLTQALIDSGLSMAAFGSSMPGAGSEHHISHCWEMRAGATHGAQQGLPALLHGAKVGVGTVMAAGWYARVRDMRRGEAARRLADAAMPDAEAEEEAIRRVYGPVAGQIIAQQAQFIRMSGEQWSALKQRILDHWDEIQAIAVRIPPPDAITAALRQAGGPGTPDELGLRPEEIAIAERYGHYTRPRFTIAKLRLFLGILM